MGTLGGTHDHTIRLPARLLVGRGLAAGLRIPDRSVSGEHAVLMWRHGGWLVRDLGSANGTYVNCERVEPGRQHPVRLGDVLRFGLLPTEFRLLEEGPPSLFARRRADGLEVSACSGVLALPSTERPLLQILPVSAGNWVCSCDASDLLVENEQVLRIGEEEWQIFLPTSSEETRRVEAGFRLAQASLTFHVSRDEETVVIELSGATGVEVMESRAHHYLLLQLARQRLRDADLPEKERGWVDRTELARSLHIDPEHLNVQLFRVRRGFSDAGVVDAGNLVEVRRRPSQLRIGVERLSIQLL